MSLAIVTSLFDLGKLEGNPHRKSVNHYLRLSKVWMQTFEPLADEIIVYCDPDLADRIPHSMGCDLEGMGAWMNLIKIAEARRENPFYQFNEAKDTPLYGCFQRTKIELLKNACRWVGTTHIA